MANFIQHPSDPSTWINIDAISKFTYVNDMVSGTETYTAFSSSGEVLFSKQFTSPLPVGTNPTTWALQTFGVGVP